MSVKTAISIPDELFQEVEESSKRLKLSRSRLFAIAVREYLDRHSSSYEATEAWNRAIDQAGQPGEDPAAKAFQHRSKSAIRTANRKAP